jgi:1,4-dihydroxy-2-naphthoate octaprenyltransferase
MGGIFIGVLSSLVLFITSFPDFEADKAKGRKTLVISVGKQKATFMFWIFPIVVYSILLAGIFYEVFPIYCVISIAMFPLIIKAGLLLKQNFDNINNLIPTMSYTITFSRITGALFVIGFLLNL